MSNQTHTPFSFSHRNSELDFLRGIAILAVIVNHGNTDIIPTLPEVSGAFGFVVWKLRALGWSGVDLFFVLSGFLIGGTLINEIEATKDLSLKRFWAKRAFKILPSYFFLLSALTILGAVKIPPDEVYIHILFLQNYLDPATFGPTWSLAVEEHFYLFLPLALTVLINTRFGKSSIPFAISPCAKSLRHRDRLGPAY